MREHKSSSGESLSGGVGGAIREGGGESPSQGHLFYTTEETWIVLEKKADPYWNEGLKIWDEFVLYVHTRPLNWNGPQSSEKLPWED